MADIEVDSLNRCEDNHSLNILTFVASYRVWLRLPLLRLEKIVHNMICADVPIYSWFLKHGIPTKCQMFIYLAYDNICFFSAGGNWITPIKFYPLSFQLVRIWSFHIEINIPALTLVEFCGPIVPEDDGFKNWHFFSLQNAEKASCREVQLCPVPVPSWGEESCKLLKFFELQGFCWDTKILFERRLRFCISDYQWVTKICGFVFYNFCPVYVPGHDAVTC